MSFILYFLKLSTGYSYNSSPSTTDSSIIHNKENPKFALKHHAENNVKDHLSSFTRTEHYRKVY